MWLNSAISNLFSSKVTLRCMNRLQGTLSAVAKSEDVNVDKLYKLVELEVRGNDPAVLKSYSYFVNMTAKELDLNIGKSWAPKKAHHERLTLLRAIHVKKKYRTQYEYRTYFSFMQFHQMTGSTASTFLEYIQRNLPEGVALKVAKVALEKLPEHIKQIPRQS